MGRTRTKAGLSNIRVCGVAIGGRTDILTGFRLCFTLKHGEFSRAINPCARWWQIRGAETSSAQTCSSASCVRPRLSPRWCSRWRTPPQRYFRSGSLPEGQWQFEFRREPSGLRREPRRARTRRLAPNPGAAIFASCATVVSARRVYQVTWRRRSTVPACPRPGGAQRYPIALC